MGLLKITRLVKGQRQNLNPDLSCSKATFLIIPALPPSIIPELVSVATWGKRKMLSLMWGWEGEREQGLVEISKDHPNEQMRRLCFPSLIPRGSRPPSLELGRKWKGGRAIGKL